MELRREVIRMILAPQKYFRLSNTKRGVEKLVACIFFLVSLMLPQLASAAGWFTDTGADDWKSTSSYNLNPSGWVNTGSTLPGALSISTAVVVGNYVYMFGGSPALNAVTNIIYRAPIANPTAWVNTGSVLPGGISNYTQTAIIGNYIYMFGGSLTAGSLSNVIYRAAVADPLTWVNTGSTLPNSFYGSSIAVINGYIYLFGGRTAGRISNIYRAPVANPLAWVDTGATIPGALQTSQAAVIGNFVYLFGGNSGGSNVIYRAPTSNPLAWVDTGSVLPSNLSGHQLAVIGSYVYSFGGYSNGSITNAIYRAPIANPTAWVNTGNTLPGSLYVSALTIMGGNVYLFGGNNGAPTNLIYRAPLTGIAPTCSVSATVNPLTYGNTTSLNWTSTTADTSFFINNVGFVTPNNSSSATVGPLSTTNYDGTAIGPGGTVSCPFTLTVTAPLNCTFNGSPVNHGSSVTAYSATQVAAGGTCGSVSQQRTCTNGVLSGTYTNATCSVAPRCSLTVTPTSILKGNSSTINWTSTAASSTSCTGTNFATGNAIAGSLSVSPVTANTYTASCTGAGGTTQCTGTGSGGLGTLLTVTCTPAYTCTGAGSQTITFTNASCSVSNVATCVSPQFCSPGSGACLNPTPSFNASGSLTGRL